MTKATILKALEKKVKVCKKCPLHKKRKNAVFGQGSFSSKIMLIGESPGAEEDFLGKSFVGKAGQILNECLKKANLKREQIFITNLVKCHPLKNRNPKIYEIETCTKNYLDRQIALIKPKVIITLGRFATNYLFTKFNFSFSKISKYHGKCFKTLINNRPIKIISMYHTAYALYNPKIKKIIEKDFKKLKNL